MGHNLLVLHDAHDREHPMQQTWHSSVNLTHRLNERPVLNAHDRDEKEQWLYLLLVRLANDDTKRGVQSLVIHCDSITGGWFNSLSERASLFLN